MIDLLGLPPDHSAHGHAIDQTMLYVHILMLILFVGWTLFFVLVLFKFRASKVAKADYEGVKSKASKYLEIAVAAVEAVLLIGFAIPIWSGLVDDPPPEGDATVVRVVAQQFAWNIHYPGEDGIFGKSSPDLVDEEVNPLGLDSDDPNGKDDITTINQLHLPVDKPAILRLSSKDVIHCLNLPYMRIKQDMIPGMEIPVWFTPKVAGSSEIACAQLCGLGHYRMKGFLTVDTAADFDKWMAEQIAAKQAEGEEDDFWDD